MGFGSLGTHPSEPKETEKQIVGEPSARRLAMADLGRICDEKNPSLKGV